MWDELLVYKSWHLEGLQALSRLMSHHGRGSKPCTLCDSTNLTVSVLSHVLLRHSDVFKVQPLPDEDVVEWVLKKLECLDLNFLTNFIRLKLSIRLRGHLQTKIFTLNVIVTLKGGGGSLANEHDVNF